MCPSPIASENIFIVSEELLGADWNKVGWKCCESEERRWKQACTSKSNNFLSLSLSLLINYEKGLNWKDGVVVVVEEVHLGAFIFRNDNKTSDVCGAASPTFSSSLGLGQGKRLLLQNTTHLHCKFSKIFFTILALVTWQILCNL